ncbi:MAG: hypothetical protein Kow0069_32030 [Promethearchaeota archaeon]
MKLTWAEVWRHPIESNFLSCFSDDFGERVKRLLITDEASHLLVVYSVSPEFAKITLRPVGDGDVLKLSIRGRASPCLDPAVVKLVTNLASRVRLVHATGFVCVGDEFAYEAYVFKETSETFQFEQFKAVENLPAVENVEVELVTSRGA